MTPRDLVTKHPHIFALAPDNVLEMYCDNHILSTMRVCPAKFYEEQLAHVGTKVTRYFSLEFGAWFHECLEMYYSCFKVTGAAPVLDTWIIACLALWDEYDIDFFAPAPGTLTKDMRGDQKKYYALCGWDTRGAITRLLIQYYAYYMNQRMRIVDTEISFGRAREVPLGKFTCCEPYRTGLVYKLPEPDKEELYFTTRNIRCFLTGRIDLLVDNGSKIGPVDHKSTARFDGYESDDFDPHEGITGYIFAINSVLTNQAKNRDGFIYSSLTSGIPQICNSGWIHHISLADAEPRFKPTPIYKTNQQLEEYRKRQLVTFRRIYELAAASEKLEDYGQIEFNTQMCNNIYNSPCPFRELHRQPFIQREGTIKQFYEIKPAWNPAEPPTRKKEGASIPNDKQLNTSGT